MPGLLPIFSFCYLFFTVEFWEAFIYIRFESFIWYMVCKCFLSVCSLSLCLLSRVCYRRKFLILMRSSLSILLFMAPTLVTCLRAIAQGLGPDDFFLMFSSKSFIVSYFTRKPVMRFKLIFVLDVRFRSKFLFFLINIQLLRHHLLKTLSFIELLLHLCKKWRPLG